MYDTNKFAPKAPRCINCAKPMQLLRRTFRFGGLPDLYSFYCVTCDEGRRRAKARGIKFGRKPTLVSALFKAFPLPGPDTVEASGKMPWLLRRAALTLTGKVDQQERRRLRRRGIAPDTTIDSLCACGRRADECTKMQLQSRSQSLAVRYVTAGSALSATALPISNFAPSTAWINISPQASSSLPTLNSGLISPAAKACPLEQEDGCPAPSTLPGPREYSAVSPKPF
jgi:hypothetical protein